jgi:DNA-binding transcriptional LysR family regulator
MEAGSLSGAARALGLTQPTVGRQVEALEAALGESLFTRSPGGLAPTRAAQTLLPHAQAMASAAQTLLRSAKGAAGEMRGVVRLTASDIIGAEVLPPILADFREAWPGVEIELVLSNRQEDLLRRDADIAVRMTRPTQDALFARKIGDVPIVLYAHRRYLQRRGVPQSIADLADHDLIGYDRVRPIAEAEAALGFALTPDMFAFRTDNDLAHIALMRAGAGLVACQTQIARHDPNLTPVLTRELRFTLEEWVVTHEDLKADRRIRALFDHLVAGLTANLAGER